MLERTLTQKIMTRLRADGWWVVKVHGGRYQSGLPDILAVKDGEVWFIECKTRYGQATPLQRAVMHALKNHGANVFIARSVDDLIEMGIR